MHIKLGKKINKQIIIYLSISVFIFVISGLIIIKVTQMKNYSYALNLMDKGKYTKAAKAFETMGNYKNSDQLKFTCELMPEYEAATRLMDVGEYTAAAIKFSKMDNFLDAKDKVIYCNNSQAYLNAKRLMDEGNYIGAASTFHRLKNFKNSETMATECVHLSEYGQAMQLYHSGEYQKARKAFGNLKDYKDSKEMIARCLEKTYRIAVKFMNKSQYSKAISTFAGIKDYKDSQKLCVICENQAIKMKYKKAETAYKAGKYFTAYQMFEELGDYASSKKNAKLCILPYPKTKVLYKNRNYNFNFAPLVIHSGADKPAYLKIYTKKGRLTATAFIKAGKSISFNMPSGTYIMKEANGTTWFGEKEMFGDDGEYSVLNTELKFLKWGMGYEITLDNGKNGNLHSRRADRKGF